MWQHLVCADTLRVVALLSPLRTPPGHNLVGLQARTETMAAEQGWFQGGMQRQLTVQARSNNSSSSLACIDGITSVGVIAVCTSSAWLLGCCLSQHMQGGNSYGYLQLLRLPAVLLQGFIHTLSIHMTYTYMAVSASL